MTHAGDFTPDINTETQSEPETRTYPPVGVVINGPVRTQDLPGVISGIRTVNLPADNTATNVANQDLRRREITLISTDQPFVVGTTKADVDGTAGAKFPINTPIIFRGTSMLYAKSATNGTAATLSVIEIDWTE